MYSVLAAFREKINFCFIIPFLTDNGRIFLFFFVTLYFVNGILHLNQIVVSIVVLMLEIYISTYYK